MARLSQPPQSMRSPMEQAQGDSHVLGSSDQLGVPTTSNVPELLDRLLRARDVAERLGCTPSNVFHMEAAGTFPKAVRLSGNFTRWSEREVALWIEARKAERRAS